MSHKLITCIVPLGIAAGLLHRLREERGIITAAAGTARGVGRLTPLVHRTAVDATEKEIVNVVVADQDADELFAFIHEAAHIDRPHGGIMYQSALQLASPFALPEVPDEQ